MDDEPNWRGMDAIALRAKANNGVAGAKAEIRRRIGCLKGALIPAWELEQRPNLRAEIARAVAR